MDRPDDSLAATIGQVWNELPRLIGDRVDLLGLELERAKHALGRIVALTLALAVFAVTAWFALWGVVVFALVAYGLSPTLALLITLAVQVIACGIVVARVLRLLPKLSLPATRRHLTFGADLEPGADDPTLRAVEPQPLNPPPEQQIPVRP